VDIKLEKCKRTDPKYQDIRNRHYVPNKGTFGQQVHYLVLLDSSVVGIISGASCVWSVKCRDEYFGITKDNRKYGLPSIINNTVFRLETHIPNLGTQVLSLFRKQIAVDWEEKYGVVVHGFETFVVEEEYRKGSMYKADNWEYIGVTSGSTKTHKGMGNKSERVVTSQKLVFAKKIKNTKLSEIYTPTWRNK